MMEYFTTLVNQTLNDLSVHPFWALMLIFWVSLGEALLIIGLFVPSTVVLVTAGTLVGAGKLEFWPVMLATIGGCIIGDQVSFWAGRWYGERLKSMWPLKYFPALMEKGEDYVRKHGGKSIAIGRFIPGIKAVVPGIAGMFGMGQVFFTVVNLISGTVWGASHVLPGILLGTALSFAGELSGRLLVALLVLFVIIGIGGWIVRLIAGMVDPHRHAVQKRFADFAQTSRFNSVRRFGEVLDPGNPNSVMLVVGMLAGVLALIMLLNIVNGLLVHQTVSDFDQSLFNFFAELRSVPGDELFIRLTMLGDNQVLFAVAAVPVLWLAFLRRWRAVAMIVAAIAIAKLVIWGFSFNLAPQGLGPRSLDFRFPSAQTLMAGTVYGVLGICCLRGLSRWSQAVVLSIFAMLVGAIAFSRLYLGVTWFSDVIGGLLIASIIVVMFAIAISTQSFRRVRPIYLIALSLAVLLLSSGLHLNRSFDRQVDRYQPVNHLIPFDTKDYLDRGWQRLPDRRINLMGQPTDAFAIQWIGSIEALQGVLARQNFKVWGRWGWRDTLPYLNDNAKIADLAPRPLVHAGLRAKLSATRLDDAVAGQRLVLRAFQSNVMITEKDSLARVFLVVLRADTARTNLGMYTLPQEHVVDDKDMSNLIAAIKADPAVETLAVKQKEGREIFILRPKS